jgi:hypothetical protein
MTAKSEIPKTRLKIPAPLHQRIKANAKKLDIQMMQYVEQAIAEKEMREA